MRLTSLHHVSFAVTNLAETRRFAEDFGLVTARNDPGRLFMRTSGGDAWCYTAAEADERAFLGLGFAVEGEDDLKEAVENHGATPIRRLDSPGGGLAVTLTNPEGLKVDLVTGIKGEEAGPPQPHLRHNAPGERIRFNGAQSQRPLGPATLFRLGHVGLFVKDLASTAAWLDSVLGIKRTDTMHPPGKPEVTVAGFYRLDRGEDWVDHHTLFLGQRGSTDAHHISFEVQDYEAQFRAHRFLEKQGWEANWGIGRHPLGSHVFDVWFDPDRYRFESFSDTDLVNSDHEPGHYDVSKQEMDVWSSDPPTRYFA